MIGYIFKIILLTILLNPYLSNAQDPIARCNAGFYYQTLPLIANQTSILNLDALFEGYNLDFDIKSADQWKPFIKLQDRVVQQGHQIPYQQLTGLKSHHLQKVGNAWGTSFVAISQKQQKTYVHYGYLNTNQSAPVINNALTVQEQKQVVCFDAVFFRVAGYILIDCAQKLPSEDERGNIYKNIFYYVDIETGQLTGDEVQSQIYVPFTSITKRQLQIYENKLSGHTLMLRSYLHHGVDKQHANNTYIDVFMVSDPLQPWIVEIIDRSFLNQKQMFIADISVYIGGIYLLDYNKGLHKMRLNDQQDILIEGFYPAKNFNKFCVYSNNLEDRFEIAISSDNIIQQIDWSDVSQPKLINKYSIMPNSDISQIFLNDRFLFVQASSPSKNNPKTLYNYTWVMTRGSRTYTKAFHTIKHDSYLNRIDLNSDQSYLIVIQNNRITNYAFDNSFLMLKLPKDQDYIDRLMNFTILAFSNQPSANTSVNCSLTLNFTLLEDNNRTLWPIGATPPSFYYANYPGKVQIPLYQYVLGPNITYNIQQFQKGDLQSYKVYQNDQLKIKWDKPLPLQQQDVRFMMTETINYRSDEDILLIYLQDFKNITYLAQCFPNHQQIQINCSLAQSKQFVGVINNWETSIFTSKLTLKTHHIIAYTTQKHYNRVYIRDIANKQSNQIQLSMGKGYAGNVTGLSIYGKYLFVNLKYYKTIQVYDLELLVENSDSNICTIDYKKMSQKLGIRFFSPEKIQISQFYPNVVFIKNVDSIIALDMSRECSFELLGIIHPVIDTKTQFSFMISVNHVIVTAIPNQVIEYDISRIYLKQIIQTKRYPLYGFKLPKNYDTDVSQYGLATFVTTVSQGGDYQIFVYRPGYPAVATLYDVIDLFTYKPVLIDASGQVIDYITVYSNKQLRIYRQYIIPLAQVRVPGKDFKFYLEYQNVVQKAKLQIIQVGIINLPMNITVNPDINDIMKTKDLLYSGDDKLSEINDTDWYEGNVVNIKSDCRDCQDLVLVKNHIHYESTIQYIQGCVDYAWSLQGGSIQLFDSLLQLNHDGSIRNIIQYPESQNTYCLFVSIPYNAPYQVSGCVTGKGVQLYFISTISHKPFAMHPYESRALQLQKIQAVHELIILVDSSNNGFAKARPGGVVIYSLNYDDEQNQMFTQVQYIDGTDFSLNSQLYIHSADLSYHPQTKTYRLYITQIRFGMLILEFSFKRGQSDILYLKQSFVDCNQLLKTYSIIRPYDSTFQGIKMAKTEYDYSLKHSNDHIVVTMGTFHTLYLSLVYDINHDLISVKLDKFFMRYAFYTVIDAIKINNDLLLLKQQLPQSLQKDKDKANLSKQIITIYDLNAINLTSSKNTPTDSQIHNIGMKGAYSLFDRNQRSFNFNLTYNSSDQHQEPRVSIAFIQQFGSKVDQMSVHKNLSILTRQTVDTQIIYLDLANDFDIQKIRILLNGFSPYPEWKLITIILFSIIGGLILIAGTLVGVRRFINQRAKRAQLNGEDMEPQEQKRQSLMTDQSSKMDKYSDRYSYTYS